MIEFVKALIALLFPKPKAPPFKLTIVPKADANHILALEASKWVGTKEVGGDNSGPDVERFQRAVSGSAHKQSWCADFAIFCIREVEKNLHIQSALYRSEQCLEIWNKSPKDLRQVTPDIGCLIIWQHNNSTLGHMGIVESIEENGTIHTIEGNTGPGAGVEREGDGVYRRVRTLAGSSQMRVLGFIKVF